MAQRRQGFALLITITLLAFLVLLLVGLSTLTRVETQVADNNQTLQKARQNALMALNIAVGQLQRYAGPDQRATARADLTVGVPNPYYVGVWDSTVAGATATNPLVWLVSGNEVNGITNTPAVDIATNSKAVLLVDKAVGSQPTLRVRVLKQAITSASVPGMVGNVPIGNFAYWVGDESFKARANLASAWPKSTSPVAVRNQEAGYNFASAQRTGIEQMARDAVPPAGAGTAIGTTAYVPNATNLLNVTVKEQLPFTLPANSTPAEITTMINAYKYRFHDVTTQSVSLLTDMRAGGLKQDLTRLLESGAAASYTAGVAAQDTDPLFGIASAPNYYQNPPTWGQLRSFANTTTNGAAIAPRLPTSTSQGIAPVLIWAEVGYGLGLNNPANTNLRVHFFPKIVLWNPYNVPLAAADYEVGYLPREQDEFNITINSGVMVSYKFFSNTFTAASGSPYGAANFLRFRMNSGVIPAGAAVLYTVQTSGAYNANGDNLLVAGDYAGSIYQEDATARLPQTPPFLMTSPNRLGDAHTYLSAWVLGQPALAINTPSANTYQYIGRVNAMDATAVSSSSATGLTPDVRNVLLANIATVSGSVASLPTRWILNGNIRAPYISRPTQVSADATYNPLYSGIITTLPSSPPIGSPVHINRLYDLSAATNDDLVLFQVPRTDTPLFSIADLRHANLSLVATGPAYPIATSLQDFRLAVRTTTSLPAPAVELTADLFSLQDYAYLLNQALWDKYFLSTVPANLTAANISDSTYSLPNSRITFLSGNNTATQVAANLIQPNLAAKNLLLKGGFNINSTSVQAWRAQLSALNALPYDPVAGTDGGTSLSVPFSRFNRPIADSTNPWKGFRQLTAVQINNLAEAIVAEVRSRGPFLSLGQFVNRALKADATGLKGPLQAAIDAMDIDVTAAKRINTNTSSAPSYQDITSIPTATSGYDLEAFCGRTPVDPILPPVSSRNAGAPGHLTQADILAAIGAGLTARGDTFLVRTYGDVQNPVTGLVTGRAWCEAVVQRMPDYMQASADAAELFPPTNADNVRFGRKFQIVSFRWLSSGDI